MGKPMGKPMGTPMGKPMGYPWYPWYHGTHVERGPGIIDPRSGKGRGRVGEDSSRARGLPNGSKIHEKGQQTSLGSNTPRVRRIIQLKAPLGEPPPPLVLSPAICGRRLWQAFRADLGQEGREGWENQGSQERAESSHKTGPDRP